MKKVLCVFCLLLMIMMAFSACDTPSTKEPDPDPEPSAEPQLKGFVVCAELNVRSSPSLASSGNIIGQIYYGSEVVILENAEDEFYLIEFAKGEDGKAYVSSNPDLVSLSDPYEGFDKYLPEKIPTTNEELVQRLMEEGQVVADFIRDMKFKYGNASINPGFNWAELDATKAIKPSEKLVSCDRIVDWILIRAGFVCQPMPNGMTVGNLDEWCALNEFEKIEDVNALKPGDIVFVDIQSFNKKPEHVFMCASEKLEDGTFLRYDAGSNERIRCQKGTELEAGKQPFKEPITGFVYAYRPNINKIGAR